MIIEKFVEHFISRHPELADGAAVFVLVAVFLLLPFLAFILLSERYNKNRYQFEKSTSNSHDYLYMLDTMKRRLYFVSGNAHYKRIHEYDWKAARDKAREEGRST